MSNEVFNQTRFVITELELKELKKLIIFSMMLNKMY